MTYNSHKKKIYVYVMELNLFFPGCQSLKEKRKILQSLKFKLKSSFNVSVAESDAFNLWQRTDLTIAAVGEKDILEKLFKDITEMFSKLGSVNLLDSKVTCY